MSGLRQLRHLRRPPRAFARWALLAAVLWAVLAPTLSHALAAVRGEIAPWSEVCSVQAPAEGRGGVQPGAVDHLLKHCPYCAMHGADLAAPPAAPAPLVAGGLQQAVPPLFLHAPRPLLAWASAQPRAPPFPA